MSYECNALFNRDINALINNYKRLLSFVSV